jgi:gas vesicle protein
MAYSKTDRNLGLGLIIGSAIGAGAAYFLSPRSGKENREMAAKKAEELRKSIENTDFQKRVNQMWGDVKGETIGFYQKTKRDLASKINYKGTEKEVGDKVEKTKEKVKEAAEKQL